MREIRLSGSEGGGTEFNRFSLPLSSGIRTVPNEEYPLRLDGAFW
jgi:hypothetical protein